MISVFCLIFSFVATRAQIKDCEVDGLVYKYGEEFPALDGCNKCVCAYGSTVACTLKYCLPSTQPSCVCNNSIMYKSGETFPALDGCNTCSCWHGSISCTQKFCPPTTVLAPP